MWVAQERCKGKIMNTLGKKTSKPSTYNTGFFVRFQKTESWKKLKLLKKKLSKFSPKLNLLKVFFFLKNHKKKLRMTDIFIPKTQFFLNAPQAAGLKLPEKKHINKKSATPVILASKGKNPPLLLFCTGQLDGDDLNDC